MSNIKYTLQFTKQNATVLLEYNQEGMLASAEITTGTFQESHFKHLFKMFPYNLSRLKKWQEMKFPNVVIRQTEEDLSFERFYELYDNKFGKKKKSQAIWKQMTNVERAKAIAFIPRYKTHLITSGQNQKYAETYLNQEPWNN